MHGHGPGPGGPGMGGGPGGPGMGGPRRGGCGCCLMPFVMIIGIIVAAIAVII